MSLQMHITGRRIGRGPRWSFLFSDQGSKEMDDYMGEWSSLFFGFACISCASLCTNVPV